MSRISITKGDTYNFTVTVKDSNGVIFDLTGYNMVLTVKDDISVADSAAVITSMATIASPTSGIGAFTLTPSDTDVTVGSYSYDIQISDGANNVYTIIKKDIFNITDQVTIDK